MLIAAVPSTEPRASRASSHGAARRGAGARQDLRAGRLALRPARVRAARRTSRSRPARRDARHRRRVGSGKSTVARCIARLVDPTAGSVKIDGTRGRELPRRRLREMRRKVQIVFQDPYRSLNPRRTVGAVIVEGPMNYGVSRADAMEARARLLELVGSTRRRSTATRTSSPAASANASASRARSRWTELLIADEAGVGARRVGAGAGPGAARRDPRAAHLAMLFITHDLRVAAQSATTSPSCRGPGGRGGPDRRGLRVAEARVHAAAARGGAGARAVLNAPIPAHSLFPRGIQR